MSRLWLVVEARAYEVEADTEAEALDLVAGNPDRTPIYASTEAELVGPPAPIAGRPALRVLA